MKNAAKNHTTDLCFEDKASGHVCWNKSQSTRYVEYNKTKLKSAFVAAIKVGGQMSNFGQRSNDLKLCEHLHITTPYNNDQSNHVQTGWVDN